MGIILNDKLTTYLFNNTRRGLLELFFNHPDESFYVNQVIKLLKAGSGAVQRELKAMLEAGLISRERSGNLVLYRANLKSPAFIELKNLFLKNSSRRVESMIAGRFILSSRRLELFCRKYHIKKLSLFGSVLRNDFNPESDIDILVEYEKGFVPGFEIINQENELSKLLKRKADIRTAADLSRYFRNDVVREARIEYEQK
jgi:uncharacterized protein